MKSNKKILYLTLKKQWFDLIKSGIKKEEYREIKQYWIKRLSNTMDLRYICFINGYGKNAPRIFVEFNGLRIGIGIKEWGAPDENVFIIELGLIVSDKEIVFIDEIKDSQTIG
jgi:hypothetical protein